MILPSKRTPRFFDRVETFEKIDQVLGRVGSNTSFRSITLWGLGGIGKSSIAARYIEKKIEENEYDAVFWVYGEKTASLRQSFTDIAMRLKLPGAQPNLHSENLILVQNWFQSTGKLILQILSEDHLSVLTDYEKTADGWWSTTMSSPPIY